MQELHKAELLSRTTELFTQSGLLNGLQKIEHRYLTRFNKHNLLTRFETGEAILVWGRKYEQDEMGVTYESKKKGWLSSVEILEMDCSLIYIHVNPHSGSIKLSGSKDLNTKAHPPEYGFRHEQQILRYSEWSENLDLVSEALATAFLYPVKLKYYSKYDKNAHTGYTNQEMPPPIG